MKETRKRSLWRCTLALTREDAAEWERESNIVLKELGSYFFFSHFFIINFFFFILLHS